MNRQKTLIISSIVLLILIALSTAQIWLGTDNQPAKQPTDSKQAPAEQLANTEVSYIAEPGISSLDQLKKVANGLVTQQSEYGEYVDAMEGNKGGENGYYWSFYVDGAMSSVGAGSYVQQGGEEIVWKYQKL